MNKNGIDISHWNRIRDFKKVADSVDFVILKAGGSDGGFYKDKCFENYYHELHDVHHVPCGAYYYVGPMCLSYDDGVEDAKRFLDMCMGKVFEYPLVIDLESTRPMYKKLATSAVIGFCETLEKAHCYAMVYASDISGFKERLELDRLKNYDKWVARYGRNPQYVKSYGIWQRSSSGSIPGIVGAVDLDVSYKDYPSIMTKAKLNVLRGY